MDMFDSIIGLLISALCFISNFYICEKWLGNIYCILNIHIKSGHAFFYLIYISLPPPESGLFERSHMQYELERDGDVAGEPSIEDMTRKAIQLLQANDKEGNGFFLFVEGAVQY